MTFKINDLITWTESPQPWFASGKVTEVSEDGSQVRFGFVRHWVRVEDCKPCTDETAQLLWSRYKDR